MKATVLKSFPYSHDGMSSETLRPGQVVSIEPGVVPGLVKAGYISLQVDAVVEEKAVEAVQENKAVSVAPENKTLKTSKKSGSRK